MKRNILMGIAIFTSLYIFTFLVDIATYLIAYNNLIKVEQLVCYYYEEYGYIPLSYLTKINKRDIYIYSNKDFYLEGEEIEYKIECKRSIMNSYVLNESIDIGGYCSSNIFIT